MLKCIILIPHVVPVVCIVYVYSYNIFYIHKHILDSVHVIVYYNLPADITPWTPV